MTKTTKLITKYTHKHQECIHLSIMNRKAYWKLSKLENLLEIRFENFMLDLHSSSGGSCSSSRSSSGSSNSGSNDSNS